MASSSGELICLNYRGEGLGNEDAPRLAEVEPDDARLGRELPALHSQYACQVSDGQRRSAHALDAA